jgi:hypothetical protein
MNNRKRGISLVVFKAFGNFKFRIKFRGTGKKS